MPCPCRQTGTRSVDSKLLRWQRARIKQKLPTWGTLSSAVGPVGLGLATQQQFCVWHTHSPPPLTPGWHTTCFISDNTSMLFTDNRFVTYQHRTCPAARTVGQEVQTGCSTCTQARAGTLETRFTTRVWCCWCTSVETRLLYLPALPLVKRAAPRPPVASWGLIHAAVEHLTSTRLSQGHKSLTPLTKTAECRWAASINRDMHTHRQRCSE
jgi:hypothetical protein